jgi:hypothetical protein
MRYFYFILLIFNIGTVYADEFDKVKVLEDRAYSRNKRFSLDVGVNNLPLDAYYKPVIVEAAGSYQFNDQLIWEFARAGYSIVNFNTGLEKDIRDRTSYLYDPPPVMKKARLVAGSTMYWNFLYGKSNFFNHRILYHQWQVGGGISYYDLTRKSQIAASLALKVNFFINNRYSIYLKGGHDIGLLSGAPRNISHLGIGSGYAF